MHPPTDIATHELGRSVGMDDIYNSAFVTMYGYSDYNDTVKSTLELPDIIGCKRCTVVDLVKIDALPL